MKDIYEFQSELMKTGYKALSIWEYAALLSNCPEDTVHINTWNSGPLATFYFKNTLLYDIMLKYVTNSSYQHRRRFEWAS